MPDQSLETSLSEQITKYREQHPELDQVLDVFNVTFAQYSEILAAQSEVRTFVTNRTLLPGEHV